MIGTQNALRAGARSRCPRNSPVINNDDSKGCLCSMPGPGSGGSEATTEQLRWGSHCWIHSTNIHGWGGELEHSQDGALVPRTSQGPPLLLSPRLHTADVPTTPSLPDPRLLRPGAPFLRSLLFRFLCELFFFLSPTLELSGLSTDALSSSS